MGRPAVPRVYPFQPLQDTTRLSVVALAGAVGMPPRSVYRYKRDGLTFDQADRLALALHRHPAEVWPTWADDGLTFLDRQFIEGGGWRDDWLFKEAHR